MHGKRTRRWWVTRAALVVGLSFELYVGWLLLARSDPLEVGRLAGSVLRAVPAWLVPPEWLVPIVGLILSVVGAVWSIRIVRGPGDEPPPWRYRDR